MNTRPAENVTTQVILIYYVTVMRHEIWIVMDRRILSSSFTDKVKPDSLLIYIVFQILNYIIEIFQE